MVRPAVLTVKKHTAKHIYILHMKTRRKLDMIMIFGVCRHDDIISRPSSRLPGIQVKIMLSAGVVAAGPPLWWWW